MPVCADGCGRLHPERDALPAEPSLYLYVRSGAPRSGAYRKHGHVARDTGCGCDARYRPIPVARAVISESRTVPDSTPCDPAFWSIQLATTEGEEFGCGEHITDRP